MRKWMLLMSVAVLMAVSASGQVKQGNVEQVLNLLDKANTTFKTVQTDFVWDQYQKVVDEHYSQQGVMYFRRSGNSVEMSADIQKPDRKYLLFSGEELQVYLPKADQVTRYMAGKNRQDFETYLVLGFGGRGHDLPKNFDVHYAGVEAVGGAQTYKLELVPKAQKARAMFRLITLWIDQQTGMSVQQKFQENGDDYRLAKYSAIRVNQKLPDNAFKLKTTGKTKYISPNS
ncbi:MAG TPA: outer membrane lipoprotein-sorting protein [Candidatus Saccharimonadales bacterium]|nr:outer membrane lipoprotein-sorting protein [Candidatus Saccharimonadales bacterium]